MEEPFLGPEINKGGFGKIYLISENEVVKKCNKDEYGINNLMEICIMNSYHHENINFANKILCTENYVYIYQKKQYLIFIIIFEIMK